MELSSASNALEMTTARKLSSSVLLLALLLYDFNFNFITSYLVLVTTSDQRSEWTD